MTRQVREGFVEWPAPEADRYRAEGYWQGQTIGTLVDEWAARWPDRVALIEGSATMTFAQLAAASTRLAGGLLSLGLRGAPHGDRVLVQMPNTIDFVVLVLACCRVGIVPTLALPAHREHDLVQLANLAEATAIVVPDSFRGYDHVALARSIAASCESLTNILVASPTPLEGADVITLAELASASAAVIPGEPTSSDVALLLLSGGTTGTPKLIPRTHDDYIYNFRASAAAGGMDESTVLMLSIPAAHNFGLGCPGVLGVLDLGGKIILEPSPEPAKAFAAMTAGGATHAALVPAVLQRWLDHAETTAVLPSGLRHVQVGGARLPEEVARRVTPILGAELQQALGMAEGLINYTRVGDPAEVAFHTQGRPVSPADEVRIVGDEGGDVSPGDTGELWTRGPYTIRGYWRAPEHNERAFDADGWYKTGDLVRWHPSGNLVVEGRLKDVINRGGEKVSAEDVENSLYALGDVKRVAVVAKPDAALGECIAAVIVASDELRPLELADLRARLTASGIARHKLPDALYLVSDLPLTKIGKIDRVALRAYVSAED